MKKNSRKKALPLQSKFHFGEQVVSLIESACLKQGGVYKVRSVKTMGDHFIYGFFEIPSTLDDYSESYFVKATDLNKALI